MSLPSSYSADSSLPSPSSSSSSSLSWSTPNSRPPQTLGINPSQLVGKVLKLVRRSPTHPNVTLHFSDNTTFQILVDGYDPVHRGIPKEIEMDPDLEPIFNHPEGQCAVDLTISKAAIVTLTDKAFVLGERESRWDQYHSAIAFKFEEENRWHCVWATLAEYNGRGRTDCVFRTYHDVYLDTPHRAPRKRKPGKGSWRDARRVR
ncbi:hypothetical protein B0H21DRAFT_99485 [Amylocystis lapponica]|nr:hypothetical protein B0H21DRAFT_99485 [Amylocystis lapponica]